MYRILFGIPSYFWTYFILEYHHGLKFWLRKSSSLNILNSVCKSVYVIFPSSLKSKLYIRSYFPFSVIVCFDVLWATSSTLLALRHPFSKKYFIDYSTKLKLSSSNFFKTPMNSVILISFFWPNMALKLDLLRKWPPSWALI